MLLYPIEYTMLGPEHYEALSAAAEIVGESDAYLGVLAPGETEWSENYDHKLLSLGRYIEYRPDRHTLLLEHVIYSRLGAWGILTSHAGYAIVGGGSARFMQVFRNELQADEEEMLAEFLRHMNEWAANGADVTWVRPVIACVYGPEKASLFECG